MFCNLLSANYHSVDCKIADHVRKSSDISGLRFEFGSKDQFGIINRLRNLLVDLSKEALREMNIGRNHRAKRLLESLVNCIK